MLLVMCHCWWCQYQFDVNLLYCQCWLWCHSWCSGLAPPVLLSFFVLFAWKWTETIRVKMKTHLKIVHIVVEIKINVQWMWVRSNMCSTLVSLTEETHHQHQHYLWVNSECSLGDLWVIRFCAIIKGKRASALFWNLPRDVKESARWDCTRMPPALCFLGMPLLV